MRGFKQSTFTVLLVLITTGGVLRDPLHDATRQGKEFYDRGQYPQALESFGRGRAEDPNHPVLAFNVGDALLAMGKVTEAQAEYRKVLSSPDIRLRARTHYNLGNAQAIQENWQEAAMAYRQSLLLDPAQKDAKRNLELALRKLKEQKQQQEQQKQEQRKKQPPAEPSAGGRGSDQDRPDQQDTKPQKKQQDKQNIDGKTAESDPNQPSRQKGGKEQADPQPGEGKGFKRPPASAMAGSKVKDGDVPTMDKAQAVQLLQALEKQEKKELLKLQQSQKRKRQSTERDW